MDALIILEGALKVAEALYYLLYYLSFSIAALAVTHLVLAVIDLRLSSKKQK